MTTKNSLVTKNELREILGEFKKDIIDEMVKIKDELMGEIKVIREEQEILSSQHGRILDLEENVEKLQAIHPHNQHAVV